MHQRTEPRTLEGAGVTRGTLCEQYFNRLVQHLGIARLTRQIHVGTDLTSGALWLDDDDALHVRVVLAVISVRAGLREVEVDALVLLEVLVPLAGATGVEGDIVLGIGPVCPGDSRATHHVHPIWRE